MYEWACLDFRDMQAIWPLCSRGTASNQDRIWATVLQGDTVHCPGCRLKIMGQRIKGCSENHGTAAFIWLIFFLEIQTLYLHFSLPYKKGRLETRCKTVFLGYITHSLLRSLNKIPIKTQSLYLFIGASSGR